MKKLFFLVILLLIILINIIDNPAQKQHAKKGFETPRTIPQIIDSLYLEISKTGMDSNRVKLFNDLSEQFREYQMDSSINYSRKAITLAQSLKWDKGLADGYYQLGSVLFLQCKFAESIDNFEKSLSINYKIGDKFSISNNISGLAENYIAKNNFDEARKYLEEAMRINFEIEYMSGIGRTYWDLGNILLKESKNDSALIYYNKALKIFEENSDDKNISNVLGFIGLSYSQLSEHNKALEYYEKALKVANQINCKSCISKWLGNSGIANYSLSNLQKAQEYYEQALLTSEELNFKRGMASWLCNMGKVYLDLSDFKKALEYFERALKISDEENDTLSISISLNFLGNANIYLGNYTKALEYYKNALAIDEESGDKRAIPIKLQNIGVAYNGLKEYDKALEYYEKSLYMFKESGAKSGISFSLLHIGGTYYYLAIDTSKNDTSGRVAYLEKSVAYEEEAATGFKELGELDNYKNSLIYLTASYKELGNNQKAFEVLQQVIILKDSIYSEETQKKIAIIEQSREIELKQKENELLAQRTKLQESELARQKEQLELMSSREQIQTLELQKKNLEINKKNNELALLAKDKEIKEIALKKKVAESEKSKKEIELLNKDKQYQNVVRNSLFGGIGLLSVLTVVLFLFFRNKKRANKNLEEKNKQITEQKEIIEKEQEKSEHLLLNVLPPLIAGRLKEGETTIADHFDEASVVFMDVVEFTKKSSYSSPENIVDVLNRLYTEFDHIAGKYGLEKIKTIGDCYMAVSGIPEPKNEHALLASLFAIESMEKMNGKVKLNNEELHFRCGIDCGSVVAGIIGEKKFIYDLWGDTVNTAARMEKNGLPGKIHVSNRFFEEISKYKCRNGDNIHEFEFEERGEMEIKGKGKMKTWFLKDMVLK
ncbi:MAG: tetratricopeptide repeat protein [Bacteroidetes bacterium]|nr:MAG: tetratricopeptide repeat protein [Bacteroidota bacterium]